MRALTVLMLLGVWVGRSSAETPEKAFAGGIVMSAKAYPSGATVEAIKKQSATWFQEDKKEHSWTIFVTGYFKAPLDDMEYVILVKDLSNKSQILLSIDKYLSNRGAKSASAKLVLDKEKVGVNKELMITMEAKGKVLALTRVKILGDYDQHGTGKVDFNAPDDDEE